VEIIQYVIIMCILYFKNF